MSTHLHNAKAHASGFKQLDFQYLIQSISFSHEIEWNTLIAQHSFPKINVYNLYSTCKFLSNVGNHFPQLKIIKKFFTSQFVHITSLHIACCKWFWSSSAFNFCFCALQFPIILLRMTSVSILQKNLLRNIFLMWTFTCEIFKCNTRIVPCWKAS